MKTIPALLLITFLILPSSKIHSQAGWFALNSGTTAELSDVYFTDVNTGFVINEFGSFIWKTIDGGQTWTQYDMGALRHANTLFFTDSQTGWASGYNSTLVKTTNGGVNWFSQPYPVGNANFALYFFNANTGIAAGYGNQIIKTTNGGNLWYSVNAGVNCNFYAMSFSDNLTGYASGGNGVIYKTTNAGETWVQQQSNTSNEIFGLYFVPNTNTGYAATGLGQILKTTNGGGLWSVVYTGAGYDMQTVFFNDINNGYAAGNNGAMLRTTNGGVTWTAQSTPIQTQISKVHFENPNVGYAVGAEGMIIKTITGGFTALTNEGSIVPNAISLGQNFPNPFNPETAISFGINKDQHVKLQVYDVTGRMVSELVNQELTAGNYNYKWNAAANSSGMYFYRLTTEGFTETKKMMLIK